MYDTPLKPYQFEAFYDVAQEEHARMLTRLAHQEHLYLTFCGDDGNHRFTKFVPHDEQQWQYLDALVAQVRQHWTAIPEELRDFELAKATYTRIKRGECR